MAKQSSQPFDEVVLQTYEKAFICIAENQYNEAINLCSHQDVQQNCAISSIPNYLLGKAYYLRGDSKGDVFASTYFLERALALGEDNDEVYSMLAHLYFRVRRFTDATKMFGFCMSEKIQTSSEWFLFGLSAFLSNNLTVSTTALCKATTANNTYTDAFILLAIVYNKHKQKKESQATLTKALELSGAKDKKNVEKIFTILTQADPQEYYTLLIASKVFDYIGFSDVSAKNLPEQSLQQPEALSAEWGQVETAKDFDWLKKNIPCQTACPALTDIPGYIGAIAVGDYQQAYAINQHYNILPGILGRVCARPCESACRHGFEGNGEAVSICFLKRVSDDFRPQKNKLVKQKLFSPTGKTVAIIGAGPAGLTAANDLALLGHQVTLYESYAKPGGMLMQGIPEFRLPRDVIKREIEQITDLGVTLLCNTTIGKDMTLRDVAHKHDAVILAAGTLKPNVITIAGITLQGVLHGLHFMEKVNAKKSVAVGKKVIVIGGGFTAFDCVRSALRLGAKNSTIYYRRTLKEMLVTKEEIEEANHEGVVIHELMAPIEIVGSKGKVTGVIFQKNILGEPDASGRRRPVPVANSEVTIPADMIILATGQSPDYASVEKFLGKDSFDKGWLSIDKKTHMTKVKSLFATGDFITGASSIIQAVGMARRTANNVDRYLMGYQRRKSVITIEPVDTTGRIREDDFIPIEPMPLVSLEQRMTMDIEVEKGYKRDEANQAAKRCYLCHYKLEINMRTCIYCDWCIKAKPDHLDCIKKVADFQINEDGIITGVTEAKTSDETKAIWIDGHECIRCGQCLRACPVDAISLKKVSLSEVTVEKNDTVPLFLPE